MIYCLYAEKRNCLWLSPGVCASSNARESFQMRLAMRRTPGCKMKASMWGRTEMQFSSVCRQHTFSMSLIIYLHLPQTHHSGCPGVRIIWESSWTCECAIRSNSMLGSLSRQVRSSSWDCVMSRAWILAWNSRYFHVNRCCRGHDF